MGLDPTAFEIDFDPLKRRMSGFAIHGDTAFDVPFISHIEGNLWTGGCTNGLILPYEFKHVVSLYPWERYTLPPNNDALRSETYWYIYDADVPSNIATIVREARRRVHDGPTLIHCQAGLNRSGLVAALLLVQNGMSPNRAINLLRRRRSHAVLCNPVFEEYVRSFQ